MKLVAVPMAHIEQAWAEALPLISRIVESADDLTLAFLWSLLRSGRGELWLAGEGAEHKAAAITEMQDRGGRTVAYCHGVASDDGRAWASVIPEWHAALKAKGAVEIRAEGRDGWMRVWPGAKALRQVYGVQL